MLKCPVTTMEERVLRGRGGSWRRGGRGGHDGDRAAGEHRGRGGRGGHDGDRAAGEHRGRGRGGHHRGRGKRDHYRGGGRGGSGHAAVSQDRGQDEEVDFQEDGNRREVFSRRKLETNWDRYEESERKEPEEDMPAQRGADYDVLLESAGDSFTQFRFLEEKDWEMDSLTAGQMSSEFVDLPALAHSLQQLPLHQRLNLEAELVQALTPVELPTMNIAPKQETSKTTTVTPAAAALKAPSTNQKVPESTDPEDDGDEELDELLGLKPALGAESVGATEEESAGAEEACEVTKEATEEKMEEVKVVTPPKSSSAKQDITEEDLEDWLDSMIS
ncbi:cell death regulator Aven isoform X2 [Hippoglossus stenolepis]|uniref:cell death regulator Aven isoform X2 n=2 Tax=Hippoglossus stenolepis TaxID=195615 RepID=UPI001FAF3E80|nr:cell death regulator Aven isoform X2 [Hippoglossus stenolepis]